MVPRKPSTEERLAEVERKVNFIYGHIVKEATAQLLPHLKESVEAQVMQELLKGAQDAQQ